MRVVNHRNLITVRRVWSSWYSHTARLASVDRPHEAPDLIGSPRVLARCRALSTTDADRTPSIDVYRLLRHSRSSASVLERLMNLSLKFGGLTTLVAHLLTSRTPGWNPREHTENPVPNFLSFLSFTLGSFRLLTHAQGFLTPHFLSQKIFTHGPFFSSF